MRTKVLNGYIYFILFIDDYSRMNWIMEMVGTMLSDSKVSDRFWIQAVGIFSIYRVEDFLGLI